MLMQAKAAESQNVATVVENKSAASPSVRTIQSVIAARLSKEVYWELHGVHEPISH